MRSVPENPEGDEARQVRGGSYGALVLPVATSILLLTLFFFFAGPDAALELFATAVATATVAGKFAVVWGLKDAGLLDSPYKVAILIVYLDLMTASIAVYNISILYRLPRFGDKILALQKNGSQILERNPWMRKVTFAGIIAFVMFPLSGTGAIGGALFGQLLGLSRTRTMVGIGIGAVVGSFAMAWLAIAFGDFMSGLQGNPAFLIGGVLVIAAVGTWLYRRAKSL